MDATVTDEALADLADLVLRVSREIDPNGSSALDVVPLTGTEVLVLRWVDMHPGTSPSATAEATALQRSNLSAALRSLVAKGMVDRRVDPRDARLVQLFATEQAAANIRVLRAHWAGKLRAALGDIADDDLDRVTDAVALLTRFDDGLRPAGS
ncbi:MarR family winged helix-turn-helix transcriptional regulator [Curtobacterium sp. SL109]|jgi:DNA-binding MarR family transcriptional regulator|uniref:MarR family winged helix-turn-helix transcriptional regulator n=1 Tax=Curtobacterium sp. SL109 TaxID=2994662 RepID=UPI002275DC4A|nr:MarR family transcriptional regulator [Curtobacterium sp. SL109]MCY1693826.1 MarR family transcriptional regulator [Curtobacterium sp. SL109]